VEDSLDSSCFYQHFCTFLSVLLLEFNKIVSVTSCTSATYDITSKRICTLWKKEEFLPRCAVCRLSVCRSLSSVMHVLWLNGKSYHKLYYTIN